MEWLGPCLLADYKSNLPPEVKFICPMARYRDVSFQIVAEAPAGTVWAFEYRIRLERDAPWVKYNDPSITTPFTNAGSCIHTFRDLIVCSDIQVRVTHTSQDSNLVGLRIWMTQWAAESAGVSGVPMPPVSMPMPPVYVVSAPEPLVSMTPAEPPPVALEKTDLPAAEATDEEEVDVSRFRQL